MLKLNDYRRFASNDAKFDQFTLDHQARYCAGHVIPEKVWLSFPKITNAQKQQQTQAYIDQQIQRWRQHAQHDYVQLDLGIFDD